MRIESDPRSNYDLCFCAEPDAPGTFFIGIMGNMGWGLWHGARLLSADEARQLRDELTAFLGDDDRHFLCDNKNLCVNARWYKTETERLKGCLKERERQFQTKMTEIHGLNDANEALRRDNADLTRQKDRLIAEAETLRRRVASLEKDAYHRVLRVQLEREQQRNRDLKANNDRQKEQLAGWEEAAKDATHAINHLQGQKTKLREENDRLRHNIDCAVSKSTELRAENARLKVDLMNARAGTTTITIGDWSRITGY